MGEMLSELCLSVNCLYASAIGLPTSCSPEHQLPKSVGLRVHPSKFPLSEHCFVIFVSEKNSLPSTCVAVLLHCVKYYYMLPSEPCIRASEREHRAKSDTGDISVDSAAGLQQCRWVHSFIASWCCEFILLSS